MNQQFLVMSVALFAFSGIYAPAQTTPPAPISQQPAPSPFMTVPDVVVDHALRFGPAFPKFAAKDISGRRWTNQDLRGKITVVYLFHTAQFGVPGPVTRDLTELQRFYDKVRDRGSVQVLTFCTDYDYTHAGELMARNKYSFPVIADWVLPAKLFPTDDCRQPCSASIPTASGQSIPIATRHWVIDAEGRLSDPARFWSLGRLLFEVEKMGSLR